MPEETQPEKKSGPEEMWAVFYADINAANVAKFVNGISSVGLQVTKAPSYPFQSWGCFVGDGVFLYNTLRKFPVEVVFYYTGQVASASAIAYLGTPSARPQPMPSL